MSTERRRYFRIDDTALIKYRVIAAEDLAQAHAEVADHVLQAANLRAALAPLAVRLAELTPALKRESAVLSEALQLLDRKLDLLAGVMTLEFGPGRAADRREHEPSSVNLSGGGVALHATLPLAVHTWLAIDLVLLPGAHALRALGRVVNCRKRGASFCIGIEFDALREEVRDTLISHVLRRQAALLRQERGARE